MRRILLVIAMFILSLFSLTGCLNIKNNIEPKPSIDKSSIYFPELNGDYAYLHVKVLAKDYDEKKLQVKILDFDSVSGVNIGDVPVGSEGELDCSDLLIFGGFKEGAEFIVSYKDENQVNLPLYIYSLESIDSFNERIAK